ncbi:hypothetical protein OE09_1645 [Flavobacteriaceae bacterium MAR_2010_72]|nr:hypothetical protein OE09_1645 [Flavobacteriaceae bacterium MAR_2010_72]TVZ59635.1 hypothetical protein NA63_2170 [Flavobacteriaceae bacterium MAR_2010_105]
MKLIQRVGYYLGGFSIGLIILAFFLSGKKTSCDYGPNARTIKNISIKKKHYSDEALAFMALHSLDTTTVSRLIKTGDVNFSESDTKTKPCNIYSIDNYLDEKAITLKVKNCDSVAIISELKINP